MPMKTHTTHTKQVEYAVNIKRGVRMHTITHGERLGGREGKTAGGASEKGVKRG